MLGNVNMWYAASWEEHGSIFGGSKSCERSCVPPSSCIDEAFTSPEGSPHSNYPLFQGNAGNMMIFYGKYWENHSGFSWIFQFSPEIYPLVSQQFAIEHGPVEIVDL